jgi:hypothetical protein
MRFISNLKSHHILLVTAVFLFASSLVIKNATTDFHLADTYYIVDYKSVLSIFTAYFIILGLIYLATRRLLYSLILTRLHVFINFTGCILLLLLVSTNQTVPPTEGPEHHRTIIKASERVFLLMIVLVLSHIIYLVNLITGLVRPRS